MEDVINGMVFIGEQGSPVTTSQIVADVFGKEHNKVCRDIENLWCSDDFRNANFGVSLKIRNLPNGGHKEERYFIMTKDGFTFLVMGYTGEKAGEFKEKFINRFNEMEQQLHSESCLGLPFLSERQTSHFQEIISLKDTIINDKLRIIELLERLYEKEGEHNYPMQPAVTIINEKASVRGRSTRKRAMLTEYENLSRFADIFFSNENNFGHPVSKFEMEHLYIKFCGLEPSKTKINAISCIFNKMLREYCLNADIIVNPTVIFTAKSDRSEGYIRRPAYETEYKYGIPTVPEQRLLTKSSRCYYFYHKDEIPESLDKVNLATGKEGLMP